ncbi:hypothetical protein ACNUFM_001717 [Vibrio cholerae]
MPKTVTVGRTWVLLSDHIRNKFSNLVGATSSDDGDSGLVPKPLKGQQNNVLNGGGSWVPQNATPTTANDILEFGIIEVSGNAANSKSLFLGGMEFVWSQSAASGGHLMMRKQAGLAKTAGTCSAYVKRYGDSSITAGTNSTNPGLWRDNLTAISATVTITAGYQYLHYELAAISGGHGKWTISVHYTGTSSLVISGAYMGPKIS